MCVFVLQNGVAKKAPLEVSEKISFSMEILGQLITHALTRSLALLISIEIL